MIAHGSQHIKTHREHAQTCLKPYSFIGKTALHIFHNMFILQGFLRVYERVYEGFTEKLTDLEFVFEEVADAEVPLQPGRSLFRHTFVLTDEWCRGQSKDPLLQWHSFS